MNFSSVTTDVIQMIHGDVNDTDCCLFNNLIKRLLASGRRWSGTHAPTDVFILGNEISRFCQTSFYPKSNGSCVPPTPCFSSGSSTICHPGQKYNPQCGCRPHPGELHPSPASPGQNRHRFPVQVHAGPGGFRQAFPRALGGHRREPLPHLPGLEPQ